MANVGSIKIREVWSENLDEEFDYIRSVIPKFRFVAMDTEFPGVVFRKVHTKQVSSTVNYSLLKQNVDALKIIQLGLTFVDSNGNLPNLGDPKYRYIWQFNFRDFDVSNDYHAPDSIAMLRTTGINFELNRKIGVDAVKFAELMMSSGLVCNGDDVTWVTFHCAYDFAYLYKVLTQVPLPSKLSTFLKLLNVYFGSRLFDVKYMIKFCDGLYGGLDRVAQLIEVDRMVGQSHQAGSDSLLTWLVFEKITEAYFSEDGIDKYNGMLYGLIPIVICIYQKTGNFSEFICLWF